jgi:hypothetical protein
MYYRADVMGLRAGEPTSNVVDPYNERAFAYAITSLELARAFAVTGFGVSSHQPGQGLAVYQVTLEEPVADPDFNLDATVQVVTSELGTIVGLADASVSMSVAQANKVMARYMRWPDGRSAYDDDGYATVPPKYLLDLRYDDHNHKNMRNELELLGTYPDPRTIAKRLEELYP